MMLTDEELKELEAATLAGVELDWRKVSPSLG